MDLNDSAYRSKVVLVDGGLYDNLGLETVWKRCKTVLASNGGCKVEADARPWLLRLLQTVRVSTIMDQQIVDLRVRQLIQSYKLGTANNTGTDDASLARAGAYWGIGSQVKDFHLSDPIEFSEAEASLAARTPTRLKALSNKDQERLINWGYVICDVIFPVSRVYM
jgi:NTE family protein